MISVKYAPVSVLKELASLPLFAELLMRQVKTVELLLLSQGTGLTGINFTVTTERLSWTLIVN